MASLGQDSKPLKGKITAIDARVSGILILNLNTEQETKSDFDGNFTINAHVDDLIVFQAANLEYLRKIVEQSDFNKGFLDIKMIVKPEQLDEVQILNYSKINAVSLGILSKPAKTYTIAERRLYEATSGGGVMMWINAINGKKKMLKKYVAFEKIGNRVSMLTDMFSTEFFIKTLGISEQDIGRFIAFAAEETLIVNALSSKNKYLISFELTKLAPTFNKLQNEK